MTVMEIDRNPPGLISRRAFRIPDNRWAVDEHWDISVPGCPMIRNPWLPHIGMEGNHYIRQIIMTDAEYNAAFPVFGDGQQSPTAA